MLSLTCVGTRQRAVAAISALGLLLFAAGPAWALPDVNLTILNSEAMPDQVIVTKGESVEVEFEVVADPLGETSMSDRIELRGLADEVLASKKRGKLLTGILSCSTTKVAVNTQVKVVYVLAQDGSVAATAPDPVTEPLKTVTVVQDAFTANLLARVLLLEESVAAGQVAFNALSGSVATAQTDITALQGDMAMAEGDITTLQTDVLGGQAAFAVSPTRRQRGTPTFPVAAATWPVVSSAASTATTTTRPKAWPLPSAVASPTRCSANGLPWEVAATAC